MEEIAVLGSFDKGRIRPLKFKWAGRVHTVKKILYRWLTREGVFPIYHFSVLTDSEDNYVIHLDTYRMQWSISTESFAEVSDE